MTNVGDKMMEKEKLSMDYNKMKEEKLSVDYKKMKNGKLSSDYKGCKILLTSRSKEVLCNQMNVKEGSTFSMGVLDKKEAETLLKKVAGIQVKDPEIDVKAIEIAEMCVGLPIALVSIGRALKNKSSFVWEDVCQQIKRQNFTGGQESIEFSIKLSYDHLKNEQLKYIFLHCARMGNDSLIMDLVKFCIGLGLLQGVYSIKEARSRVKVLIDELKESSLLVESYSNDRFNMHDIVRDVALSISSKEKRVFFMKNDILDEWPVKDKLESYTAIFLHSCDINDELPENIYCPKLEVFHIDGRDDFLKIPDNFFKGMTGLRVLILTGVNLSFVPSSIKCLTKLRMLCLERCTLGENLSIIGELKKLKITLSGSNIESLPVELRQLDKLQLFDLSNCLKLRVIPSNMISRMNSLEELYMGDNLILWEAEQRTQSEKISLSELRHLDQLRTLEICIPSVVHFPLDLFFDKLDSYKIVIGEFNKLSVEELKMPNKYETLKTLALHLNEGIDIHSQEGVKMLFKRVENLVLGELNNVRDVFYELNVEGFLDLKYLSILKNSGFQYIINSMEKLHPLQVFPKLESMCLYKLENLEKICDNQLTGVSFCQLKIMKIKTCGKLKHLFSFTMVRLLTKLETIELCDCDSLKEIVSAERQAYPINYVKDDKIDFPQLRFLTLQSLPAFTYLYVNDKLPSISQSWKDQVPNKYDELTTEVEQGANACLSLFNEKVSIPKLEWLELSSINIQKIWSDQSLHCFQNLLTLNVAACGNLKYLLSISMAGSLVNLQSLYVSGCELIGDIFRTEDEMHNVDIFPSLKKMEIICMESLNTIWPPYIGLHSFHNLESLMVRECDKLVTIIPCYVGHGFQNLRTLSVINCQSVEYIFDFGNISQANGRDETNLREVILDVLPNLVNVWKVDSNGVLNYNNLQSIGVNDCPNLEYLFPFSIAIGLAKLESLKIGICLGLKEVVAWDNKANEEVITFKFPLLDTLSFSHLSELGNFYRGNHTLEWPSLKTLIIIHCGKLEAITTETSHSKVKPIFSATEKVIYNLTYMAISLKEAKWLQNEVVTVHRMHKLLSLGLLGLKSTEILFWFLHRLPNLKSLMLDRCLFKRFWVPASLISREKIGVVVQLSELILNDLLLLDEIGFEHNPLLQRVECILINRCSKLTSLAPSSVSFSYLTYLEVVSCHRLKNLLTTSTAKSLVQLTIMKVNSCLNMMEIVAENEEEKVQEIEFKQLKALELVFLQSLTCFCSSKKCDFKFPFLENLEVSECPQMAKFSEVQSAPNLQKVHIGARIKNKWYWEGDLNGTIQKIFTDQVYFEYSKYISSYSMLEDVRLGKPSFPDDFFQGFKILNLDNSFKNDIVIPSHVLCYLKNLEELHVNNCNAVQVIFDIDDTETKKTKRTIFRLKKLTLKELPNLELVWNKNPEGIVTFPYLKEVVVIDCGSLTTLFPSSLARNLRKIKKLEVLRCDMLVEIVGKEDTLELGSTERFVVFEFPCLSLLFLRMLPQLSCFYPGRHHLECPILEGLEVLYCFKLELFTSEFHSRQEAFAEGQVGTTSPTNQQLHQPLFLVQKVVPKLKKLALNEKNIILLSNANLQLDLLRELILCFEGDHEEATLPFDFHKVPNIESLQVESCRGLEEIFPSQKLQVHDGTLGGLKKLTLTLPGELNLIGFEHPWVKPYSEKLDELMVVNCSRLEKLVHNTVSFINLKKLGVGGCNRIKCLFTYSTFKSMVQLESLLVTYCESLKEIVTKEDEGSSDHDMIIFGRLKFFFLCDLPSLVCFYSGKATLHFSFLQIVGIIGCPNMKTFSGGVTNAPLVPWIYTSKLDPPVSDFNDDLNAATESLHHQKVASEAEHVTLMKFGDQPRLEEIWLGIVPIPSDKCFKNLTSIIVVECESLSIVIPFYLLPLLCNLKAMEVRNCQSVKAIFDVKGIESLDMKPTIPLKRLTLIQLPNLEYIWNMNPDGILSLLDLQEVHIYHCQILKSLFQILVVNHLVILDVRSCERLEEIFAEDESALKGATIQLIFHCLTSLTLWRLPKLKHLYPGKHSLEWPMLTHLDVYHCHKLKLFTTEPPSFQDTHLADQLDVPIDQQAIFSVEKVFPKLEVLSLRKEDIMMIMQGRIQRTITKEDAMIGQQQFGANIAHLLQNLKVLGLQCFHEDDESNVLFSSGLLEKLPKIEYLVVMCSSFNEIFSSQRLSADCTKVLSKLKRLGLHWLPNLNSSGLEHSWVEPFPKTLETLEVSYCPYLKILVPSTVSFSSLAYLDVSKCHGLECLFTSSTAKSLGLLNQMHIWNCQAIREIVSKEGENDEEITFGQLNILSLQFLPNMVGFHTGTSKLKFPSLEQVTLMECPQMKYSYVPNMRQFIPIS